MGCEMLYSILGSWSVFSEKTPEPLKTNYLICEGVPILEWVESGHLLASLTEKVKAMPSFGASRSFTAITPVGMLEQAVVRIQAYGNEIGTSVLRILPIKRMSTLVGVQLLRLNSARPHFPPPIRGRLYYSLPLMKLVE